MSEFAPWFHCSVKPISRSAGRSVVAAAAYRLGVSLQDEKYGLTQDYSRRGGIENRFTVTQADAAEWADDPGRLWNAAEAAENRRNSQVGRECELALPAELTPTARLAVTRQFAEALVDRYGVAVSVGIHTPSSFGDIRNFHAHVLMTTRSLDPDGFGKKTRVLDDKKTGPAEINWMRETAASLINAALEEAGSDERVTHLSFAARGIDQVPTEHLGPTASEIERRDPGSSDRANRNRDIADRNQTIDGLVAELAALDAEIAKAEEQRLDERYGADEEPGAVTPQEIAAASFDAAMRPAIEALEQSLDIGNAPSMTAADEQTPRETIAASFDATLRPAVALLNATGETWAGGRLWQKTIELYQRGAEMLADLGREAAGYWQRLVSGERDPDRPPDGPDR